MTWTNVTIRFSQEDLALLDALAAHERRNRSDTIRWALHAQAKKLGLEPVPPTPKKKARR